jgi:hypothetical protein
MKIVTASNGKKTVKMSKKEWQAIGKKAGWMKKAENKNIDFVDDDYVFWKARSIFTQGSRTLDIPAEKGYFLNGEKTPARSRFIKDILSSEEFKLWLSKQSYTSEDIYEKRVNSMVFKASNKASHGYTYLWAWQDESAKQEELIDHFKSLGYVITNAYNDNSGLVIEMENKKDGSTIYIDEYGNVS